MRLWRQRRGVEPRLRLSLAERLDALSIPEPNSGCWLWTASLGSHGYGQINVVANGKSNIQAAQANARLAAEINDLRDGLEMVEERARAEIGMVKPNEIFVQIAR